VSAKHRDDSLLQLKPQSETSSRSSDVSGAPYHKLPEAVLTQKCAPARCGAGSVPKAEAVPGALSLLEAALVLSPDCGAGSGCEESGGRSVLGGRAGQAVPLPALPGAKRLLSTAACRRRVAGRGMTFPSFS